jgi:signal transduction histidine kinase
MRRPLRWQILLPMLTVTLAALVGASGLNAWLSTRRTQREIEQKLGDVVQTLAVGTFPFSDAVLKQTRGLTGAELAVTGLDGELLASSSEDLIGAARENEPAAGGPLVLGRTVDVAGRQYFYVSALLDRRAVGREQVLLHIYYPLEHWRAARNEAVFSPLAVGGGAMVLVALLSVVIAARVTRPIAQLESQVERISHGDFTPLPLGSRSDEIRDLGASINRMAAMLARYEEQVRRTERLRTLGQLGGGVAHQMRNAATGCRMALDLHRRTCPGGESDENLDVAERQLTLMEQHLRRYLALGRSEPRERRIVDLEQLVQDVLPLVRHTAEHVGVQLDFEPPSQPVAVEADAQAVQQVIVNLLLNAIEAGSAAGHESAAAGDLRGAVRLPRVSLSIARADDRGNVRLRVRDTGRGPSPELSERLFEPLVSDKPDGAGLGLAVAREIVEHHGGAISWRRDAGETVFLVELPSAAIPTNVEAAHGASIDR